VLVTGSSTGLGLEIALHLAERGFRSYATVRDLASRPQVEDAAAQRGVTVEVLQLDVTDPASVDRAVSSIVGSAGGIYGLVNNAGIGLRGCFEDLTDAEMRRLYETNVFGTMNVTRRVLPHMREARRGRVITISSVAGKIASFGLTGYCSTKFAQEGFAEALALELAPFGVCSVLVEPGIVKTSRWSTNRGTAAGAYAADSAYSGMFRRHEEMSDKVVERSRTRPEHVAKAVHQALTAARPRMRYPVGQPASTVMSLRRHIPGEIFERIYFGILLRRLVGKQEQPLAGASP
jgi:NAD(P)-dependent dehydrogenase (short-subunit alcohol dehydrogenase family)